MLDITNISNINIINIFFYYINVGYIDDNIFFYYINVGYIDINVGYIDTEMVIIPFNLCKNIKLLLDVYEADGHYIKDCIDSNRDKHVYIDQDLCYYNFFIYIKDCIDSNRDKHVYIDQDLCYYNFLK